MKADTNTNVKRKHFKVRYNPKNSSNGKDPFMFKNTEWFYSKKQVLEEDDRLRYHKKKYILFKNAQGENDGVGWEPPEIKYRQSLANIQINDHMFVKFDKYGWRRSMVVGKGRDRFNGIYLTVKNLMDGNEEKLDVISTRDNNGNIYSDRIEFCDMRHITIFPTPRNRS